MASYRSATTDRVGGSESAGDGLREQGESGRGRVEVICGGQDSACFARYLAALDQRHATTGREIFLVLDHASCHTSAASARALAERAAWLHLIWLAKYSPHLNEKEREWR